METRGDSGARGPLQPCRARLVHLSQPGQRQVPNPRAFSVGPSAARPRPRARRCHRVARSGTGTGTGTGTRTPRAPSAPRPAAAAVSALTRPGSSWLRSRLAPALGSARRSAPARPGLGSGSRRGAFVAAAAAVSGYSADRAEWRARTPRLLLRRRVAWLRGASPVFSLLQFFFFLHFETSPGRPAVQAGRQSLRPSVLPCVRPSVRPSAAPPAGPAPRSTHPLPAASPTPLRAAEPNAAPATSAWAGRGAQTSPFTARSSRQMAPLQAPGLRPPRTPACFTGRRGQEPCSPGAAPLGTQTPSPFSLVDAGDSSNPRPRSMAILALL